MLNNYLSTLKNEITSNFGIYDGVNDFRFIFKVKLDKPIDVNYSEIYEKMFGNRSQHTQYSIPAFAKFYGVSGEEIKTSLANVLSGDFTGIKSRDQNSLKVLKVLSSIVDIIEKEDSLRIISSVRDAESEFNNLRMVLTKLTGEFKKEDADRFKVITSIYEKFKDKPVKIFLPLVQTYSELSEKGLEYSEAKKINKKLVSKLLDIFNSNETVFVETISELQSISPKLFGKSMAQINDLLSDRVSDDEIDNYKPLISFYLQHIDSLVELAKTPLSTIVNQYTSIDDDRIQELKNNISTVFGSDVIVDERLIDAKTYMFAISYGGRYEPIIKFIEDNDIKIFTVLMILPETEIPIKDNPSLRFLITALSDDIDDAIDELGRKPSLDIKQIGQYEAIQLIGTGSNNQDGKDYAMIMYLSILAVTHGFDAKKLPFVQKFA